MKSFVVPESSYGVCVWKLPDGSYFGNGNGSYLSMEGVIGDFRVEHKMRNAALWWMGDNFCGEPEWLHGARKVTDMEHDDQMERLVDGRIPDPVDEARQIMNRNR